MNYTKNSNEKLLTGDAIESSNVKSHLLCITSLLFLAFGLSGCLVTSPKQVTRIYNIGDSVPIQVWTLNKNLPIEIECAKADSFGSSASPAFQLVQFITPSSSPIYDSKAHQVYSASTKLVFPQSCWHKWPGFDEYTTFVRISQNGFTFYTFDNAGLECLGTKVGETGSWLGWLNQGCESTWSNTGEKKGYVLINARP